ncbi:hypothetical protein [Actinoplanes regularis]|uniref:hypothetical protein n=1 Tax=Actinoplanes regularis TaxID=52697 RepID=UPI0025561100|nr:hypothetical protein [Actinoplanes regularis]
MDRPTLTPEEQDLVAEAERQAVAGLVFDAEAGLADLRRRARQITPARSPRSHTTTACRQAVPKPRRAERAVSGDRLKPAVLAFAGVVAAGLLGTGMATTPAREPGSLDPVGPYPVVSAHRLAEPEIRPGGPAPHGVPGGSRTAVREPDGRMATGRLPQGSTAGAAGTAPTEPDGTGVDGAEPGRPGTTGTPPDPVPDATGDPRAGLTAADTADDGGVTGVASSDWLFMGAAPYAGPPQPSLIRSTEPVPAPTATPGAAPTVVPGAAPAIATRALPPGTVDSPFRELYPATVVVVPLATSRSRPIDLRKPHAAVAEGGGDMRVFESRYTGGLYLHAFRNVRTAAVADEAATSGDCARAIRERPSGSTLELRENRTYCLMRSGADPSGPALVRINVESTVGTTPKGVTLTMAAWGTGS